MCFLTNNSFSQIFQFIKRITIENKNEIFINIFFNDISIKLIIEEEKTFVYFNNSSIICGEYHICGAKTLAKNVMHILKKHGDIVLKLSLINR